MLAAEDIQRQITVVIVIAVKEPPLLMTMQRIIGGVQIQDDLPRRRRMRVEKQLDPQPLDRFGVRADLVIATDPLRGMQLQTVQRALAGQRCALRTTLRLKLAQQRANHCIVPQMLMVVEVFIAQGHGEYALADQRPERVLDQLRIALIDKTLRQPIHQSDRLIGFPKQHRPRIRADRAAIKRRDHSASLYA